VRAQEAVAKEQTQRASQYMFKPSPGVAVHTKGRAVVAAGSIASSARDAMSARVAELLREGAHGGARPD
jgi:hypothetical protein